MRFDLKIALFLLLSPLLFFLSAAKAQASASVKNIRHWSTPDYTRIVIDIDGKAPFTHKLLQQDPSINIQSRRLFVDVKGAVLDKNLQKQIPINDGLLKMARAGQFDKDTVRVVLDIESIEDFKIFPLTEPFRIVIDVTGKSAAPKEAKEEVSKAETQADRPANAEDPKEDDKRPSKKGISLSQQLGLKVKTIVLDPGHGGKDPGAIGRSGLKEKDVTLRLGKMLRENLSQKIGSKIVMTRETDVFIPLEERTAIANSKDADLFVSIHINASPKRAASGIGTYILNFSVNEESKRLAARENATSTKSVSDLEFILQDLIKTAKTNDSARLATAVQDRLVASLRAKYRNIKGNGVKGAPFYVLVGTKMPSILIEVSFISNPDEEKRLKDEKYLKEVVDGITSGLINYMNSAGSV